MWYTCISGYRKRTPHFRLLPMVKCPLDCFLVYSFLLDVEQAKIRHAPFGTFAFSDKPLRNPSEHSDFWYIQGRIFSSCGLSETQGLPRSLVRFRAHRGENANNDSIFIRYAPLTSLIDAEETKEKLPLYSKFLSMMSDSYATELRLSKKSSASNTVEKVTQYLQSH